MSTRKIGSSLVPTFSLRRILRRRFIERYGLNEFNLQWLISIYIHIYANRISKNFEIFKKYIYANTKKIRRLRRRFEQYTVFMMKNYTVFEVLRRRRDFLKGFEQFYIDFAIENNHFELYKM